MLGDEIPDALGSGMPLIGVEDLQQVVQHALFDVHRLEACLLVVR